MAESKGEGKDYDDEKQEKGANRFAENELLMIVCGQASVKVRHLHYTKRFIERHHG